MMLTQIKPLGQLKHKKYVTFNLGTGKEGNTKEHILATNLFKQNYTPFFSTGINITFPTHQQTREVLHDIVSQLAENNLARTQPSSIVYVTDNPETAPEEGTFNIDQVFDVTSDGGEKALRSYRSWFERRENFKEDVYDDYAIPGIFMFDLENTESISQSLQTLITEISLYGRQHCFFSIIGAPSFYDIYPGDYLPTNAAWFGLLPENYSTISHRPSVIQQKDGEVIFMQMYGMEPEYITPLIQVRDA